MEWRDEVFDFFKIGNGIKQGAVLSAVLNCVYTNDLFKEPLSKYWFLYRSELCRINRVSDDLPLISPSIDDL